VRWVLLAFFEKLPDKDFFFASFLLYPGIKEKSVFSQTSIKIAVPVFRNGLISITLS